MIPRATALLAALASCSSVAGPEGGGTEAVEPRLEDIWAKVFVRQCAFSSCHSMEGHRAGLVLATSRQAEAGAAEFLLACTNLVNQPVENPNIGERIRVVPGDAQQSFLVEVLEGRIDRQETCSRDEDCNCPMPYNSNCTATMPADPVLAIRQWVDGLGDDACADFGAEPARDGPGPTPDGAGGAEAIVDGTD